MSTRVRQLDARVVDQTSLSPHLTRLRLSCPDLISTGVPDEWVGLVVPGQFQSRYYTVRSQVGTELELDVVVHDHGLVTGWVDRDVVGERVVLHEPKGSFAVPEDAGWLMLVGDLTALPAMARIAETTALPVQVWAEGPEPVDDYLPERAQVTWLTPDAETETGTGTGDGSGADRSRLADVVAELAWPAGPGYFWMAGESAQMRAIRKHLMRERELPASAYDVMGYWRASTGRRPRAVDPAPTWREGRAEGLRDEQVHAADDRARA